MDKEFEALHNIADVFKVDNNARLAIDHQELRAIIDLMNKLNVLDNTTADRTKIAVYSMGNEILQELFRMVGFVK